MRQVWEMSGSGYEVVLNIRGSEYTRVLDKPLF